MKKEYIKPRIDLIDLTAKEILMSDDRDPILDAKYGIDIGYTSVPDEVYWY